MLLLGAAVALPCSAAVQDDELHPVEYPTLAKFAGQPTDFVPKGWKLVAVETGDLNGDRRPDVAVLMRMKDPARIKTVENNPYYKTDDTNPYLLAVAFANGQGYVLVASNHSLFPDDTAPIHADTPPDGDTVKIARGVLTLSFEHLRSHEQFSFRWDGKAFALVGFDCGGVSGGTYIGLSANYLTRKARIERGDVSDDRTAATTILIRPGKRPTLEQLDTKDWYFELGKDADGDDLSC
ncbi:MAG: hypothetical protein ABIW58_02210 [Sphingomicrobium sp.]